jgi:hypothetical protein
MLKLIDRFPFIIRGRRCPVMWRARCCHEALFVTIVETRHYLHWLIPAFCAAGAGDRQMAGDAQGGFHASDRPVDETVSAGRDKSPNSQT